MEYYKRTNTSHIDRLTIKDLIKSVKDDDVNKILLLGMSVVGKSTLSHKFQIKQLNLNFFIYSIIIFVY